jgi:hypothetical protein
VSFVHAQVFSVVQNERVQYLTNHRDDGKAYFYNDTLHMYNLSCFMYDSDLTTEQQQAKTLRRIEEGNVGAFIGRGVSVWKRYYEEYFRLSNSVPRNRIVTFEWRGIRYWGYIVSYNLTLSATDPNVAILGLVFLSIWEDNENRPPEITLGDGQSITTTADTSNIVGDLSREGFAMIFRDSLGTPVTALDSRVGKKLQNGTGRR